MLTDAKLNDVNTWLPNKEVLDMIARVPARHTLLITDACFSGSVFRTCLLYTSDAADERSSVDLGGRRIINKKKYNKKKKKKKHQQLLVMNPPVCVTIQYPTTNALQQRTPHHTTTISAQ